MTSQSFAMRSGSLPPGQGTCERPQVLIGGRPLVSPWSLSAVMVRDLDLQFAGK